MNILRKTIIGAAVLTATSGGAFAGVVTVGGVTWNTDAPSDFWGSYTINQSVLNEANFIGEIGKTVIGYGSITRINDQTLNCNACELTYTYSYRLKSVQMFAGVDTTNPMAPTFSIASYTDSTGTNPTITSGYSLAQFTSITTEKLLNFDNFNFNVKIDSSQNYNITPSYSNANDGILFLSATGDGLFSGSRIGGEGFLSVTGGLAAQYFNTNTKNNGASDLFVSVSGLALNNAGTSRTGSGNIYGKTREIPEPISLALLGIGLLGFGVSKKRKQA